ncbi:MAG: winged helix DNA-binding protein [Spirochaetaceae bacterium]|nr:winged helix DNA-binding protein [Spirochaetaceae bacterium]
MNSDIVSARHLFELAASVQQRIRKAVEAALRLKDLTYAQFGALTALGKGDGLSQAELAAALETDSTTAMVLRTSLEKKGLVKRSGDQADGRVKRIAVTAEGRRVLADAEPVVAAAYAAADGLVSEQEAKRTAAVLERLRDFALAAAIAAAPKKASSEGGEKRRGRPRKNPEAAAPEAKKGRGRKQAAEGKAPKSAPKAEKKTKSVKPAASKAALKAGAKKGGAAAPKAKKAKPAAAKPKAKTEPKAKAAKKA